MLHKLINRSPDLKKLANEGYGLEVKSGYLLVHEIPYVNTEKKPMRGTLVLKLDLADDKTVQPGNHEAYFIGETPCDKDGKPLTGIINSSNLQNLTNELFVNHHFSAKPSEGSYPDYYVKVSTYAAILFSPAQIIEPGISPKTFKPIVSDDEESVFNYLDTNATRADIVQVSQKLENLKIGIVGLGGTGSYVLDFVAKTWIKEIHIFDGDFFYNHNAYRIPGAASPEDLNKKSKKVYYHREVYSKLRKNIYSHDYDIDESNVEDLLGMNFVFVCIDNANTKKIIIDRLIQKQIPLIDVGMGVEFVEGCLRGGLRTTLITSGKHDHVATNISLSDSGNEEYSQNIQLAELNALNAALAVIKWKKYYGFYHDFEKEQNSIYNIDVNQLVNNEYKT